MIYRALPTATLLAAGALLAGCNCNEPATLDGQVVDIWGNPVPEATIALEDETVRPMTDANGYFSLPLKEGTLKIKVGKEGYIQEHVEVVIEAGAEDPSGPTIELYPKPEENGFFVVSKGEYKQLEPERVKAQGNDLGTISGVKAVKLEVESDPFEVVFHTDLRLDEIKRLDLELHKVEYKETAEFEGIAGKAEVDLKLFVSAGEVEVNVDPMKSKDDYLITVTAEDGLEPGIYAFHTHNLLDPDDQESFNAIPEAMRVAFPFEYR